jgi:hypothetical protein
MSKSENENSTIIEEKSLKGEGNPVLRLVRLEGSGNSLRLCISSRGLITSAVFGGEASMLIATENCRDYFKIIQSSEQFIQLSEHLRKTLIDALKA